MPVLLGAEETRETFAGLETWQIVLWYVLIAVSVAIFFFGVGRLALKYRRGRTKAPVGNPLQRAVATTKIVATHAWIRRRDPLSGLGHLLVFYGFVVLFIGTGILAFQDDFAEPVLGWVFWQGWFYLGYSLFLDVFGFALIVGLSVFAVKRGILRPFRLSYWRPAEPAAPLADEAEALPRRRLALPRQPALPRPHRLPARVLPHRRGRPVLREVGAVRLARRPGLHRHGLRRRRRPSPPARSTWWVHGVFALFWVSSIPFTKAVHMLAGPAGVAVKDERAGNALLPLPADAKPEEVGYATIDALAPKHLLDLDACTKCGKCHAACPATASGYPLSPRDLVLDLREVAEGSMGNRAALRIPPRFPEHADILGDRIKPETLWSCMQCMACVEICPVGIEHVPIINQMRRALVERGEMDGQLQQTLETIYTSGNSFGEAKRKRGRWAKDLDFEVKDARKERAEILWFVGDYASFDPRNQRISQALARVLRQAGVDFGILYDGERTAGNDVRRVGEEGLWSSLAEENVETISACRFDRILTSDPHTFNTLKNEYPQLGGDWNVVHHSQLLLELLQAGRLRPRKGLGYRVTYHDPCTLGRYNGVYDEPREVIASLGCELVEMPRNRDNSFCCGAGGGRIWMKELKSEDAQRPSESRIDEAVGLDGDRLLRRRLPEGRDHVRGRDQDLRPPGRDRAAGALRARARVARPRCLTGNSRTCGWQVRHGAGSSRSPLRVLPGTRLRANPTPGLVATAPASTESPAKHQQRKGELVSKETAFYPRLKALTDEWMDLFGYWAPTVVTDTEEEYRAVRETAGLMDFTMLRKVDLDGPGALDLVNSIVTRDVSELDPRPHRLRRARRRRREDGRRLHDDDAGARPRPVLRRERPRLRDLQRRGRGLGHRGARDHRRDAASLSPGAEKPRDPPGADDADLSNAAFPYYTFREDVEIAGIPVFMTRLGYTAELGYELWVERDRALRALGRAARGREPQGMKLIGMIALDLFRIEGGFIIGGIEYDPTVSPYECGLGWSVDLDKGEFQGRAALTRGKDETQLRLTSVVLESGGDEASGAPLWVDDEEVGLVTQAVVSPFLGGKTLGLAKIRKDLRELGPGRRRTGRRGADRRRGRPAPGLRQGAEAGEGELARPG